MKPSKPKHGLKSWSHDETSGRHPLGWYLGGMRFVWDHQDKVKHGKTTQQKQTPHVRLESRLHINVQLIPIKSKVLLDLIWHGLTWMSINHACSRLLLALSEKLYSQDDSTPSFRFLEGDSMSDEKITRWFQGILWVLWGDIYCIILIT